MLACRKANFATVLLSTPDAMPRIQDHLQKLSWVAADKALFVLYGAIALLQIRALAPAEYGLYALLVSIQTWIFVVADGLVLQGIIQFGAERDKRRELDGTAAAVYVFVIAASVAALILAEPMLRRVFGEPRFATVVMLEVLFCFVTIPRTYCLRILQRDIQTRPIFWIDLAWLGSMSIATIHGIGVGWLHQFESLASIAIGGMACSSAAAVLICRGLLRFRPPNRRWLRTLLNFGTSQTSISLIHTSVRQLDIVLAQTFFGTATVGIYQAAKTIFRFFELGFDAAGSVVYPAAVSLQHSGDRAALHTVASKAMSVLMIAYGAGCIALWGAGHVLGLVLGQRYGAAIGQLQLMSLASLAMPLVMTGIILVAAGYSAVHARNTALAALAALACFVGSSVGGNAQLFPLGVVAYYVVLGMGDWAAVVQRGILQLRLRDLARSIPDAAAFFRGRRE